MQNNEYEKLANEIADSASEHAVMGVQWLWYLLGRAIVYALLAIAKEISDLREEIRP